MVRVERNHDLDVVLAYESRHFLRGRGEVEHRALLDGDGFFRAVDDAGATLGVCACVAYPGGRLAWIGGMVVPPENRRRGVARALLHACLRHATEGGASTVGLDATAMGKPLYVSEDFVDVCGTTRWVRDAAGSAPAMEAERSAVFPFSLAELAEVTKYDLERFGANRAPWIAEVMRAFPHRAFVAYARGSGALAGYVLGQDRFVGPLVADGPAHARALLAATVAAGTPPVMHLLDGNAEAIAVARSAGLHPTDVRCERMVRGGPLPGRPSTHFAVAAWALG